MPSPTPLSVLVVQESAIEATVLLEAMTRAAPGRFEFAVVSSLRAALKRLRDAPPACVLADLALGGSVGAQAVTAMRDAAPVTPLIAFAPLGDAEAACEAIRQGADDCLEKSGFDARQLCRAIDLAVERGHARGRLLGRALRDPLTGLANRAQFEESLTRAAARAGRSGSLMALLYLDLDGFKPVNDTFGHDAGDALLKVVSARFSAQVRAGDTLARMGGDEFAVILENLPSVEAAATVARKLVRALEAPVLIGDESVQVTCSVGIAFRPADGIESAELMRAADSAMYAAKRHGGNRIGSYSSLLGADSGLNQRPPRSAAVPKTAPVPVLQLQVVSSDDRWAS